jgi:hypothetical protein
MRILVLCGLLLSLLGTTSLSAQVHKLELQQLPPLKPLHYCQDSEGQVKEQIEECEPGKTEVSSIVVICHDGRRIHAPLGTTWNSDHKHLCATKPDTSAATPVATTPVATTPDTLAQYKALRSYVVLLFIVSLIVSVIAARRGRSGVLTFLVCVLGGILLYSIIGAAGKGVSGTTAEIGSLAVPAIMLIRALASGST